MSEKVTKKARQLLDALQVPHDLLVELDAILEEEGPKRRGEEEAMEEEGCDCVSVSMSHLSEAGRALGTTLKLYGKNIGEFIIHIEEHGKTPSVITSLMELIQKNTDEDKKEESVH